MAWDVSELPRPGDLYSATELQQIITNLKNLRGQDSGQTQIDLSSPVIVPDFYRSTATDTFEIRKQWSATTGYPYFIFQGVDADDPSGVEDDDQLNINQDIGILAGATYTYGQHRWIREAEASGKYQFRGAYSVEGWDVTVLPSGYVGILHENPEYALDIGSGDINVSGSYRISGTALTDWAETAGSPDRVDWTGPVKVGGAFVSTVATGTAPVSVASTTECSTVDAEYLDGCGWHPGIQAADGLADIGTSHTVFADLTLDRVGKWLIVGTGVIDSYSATDDGDTFEVKLKVSGGAQIGATVEMEFNDSTDESTSPARSFLVMGGVTSAGGTDVIEMTGAVPTGTGLDNYFYGRICAVWLGP